MTVAHHPAVVMTAMGLYSSTCTPTSIATPTLSTSTTTPLVNPLVSAGLIPKRLEDLLQSSPAQTRRTANMSIVTKARVITSDE